MEVGSSLKQIAFSLAITGFIPGLFLCAQTIGMGMRTDQSIVLKHGSLPDLGFTTLEELVLRYSLISVCFLLFIFLFLIRNQVFRGVMGLIPLIFIILQCRLLIIFKNELFDGKWIYSNWLEITYFIDFGFLALTVLLLILQLYSVWLIHR